jgi:hypothetical protein
MKKSTANKWVKALRSGKYKQGEGHLRSVNKKGKASYCCLGVLAKVNKVDSNFIDYNDLLHVRDIREQCGIANRCGAAINEDGDQVYPGFKVKGTYKEFKSLADANDEGVSFKAIARWIEKNYKYL